MAMTTNVATHDANSHLAHPESRAQDATRYIVPIGRLLFTGIFLASVPMHFSAKAVGYAAHAGVPLAGLAVPASGLLELVGALMVLLGYRAKIGAWLLVAFLVPV